jgi:hypothetical protein
MIRSSAQAEAPDVEDDPEGTWRLTSTPALRQLLRVILGVAAIPLTPTAIHLFARHFGSYIDTSGCETAGGAGTVWAIGEGITGIVGIGGALLFAFNIWSYADPETRRASNLTFGCAVIGLAIWTGLLLVVPTIRPCA